VWAPCSPGTKEKECEALAETISMKTFTIFRLEVVGNPFAHVVQPKGYKGATKELQRSYKGAGATQNPRRAFRSSYFHTYIYIYVSNYFHIFPYMFLYVLFSVHVFTVSACVAALLSLEQRWYTKKGGAIHCNAKVFRFGLGSHLPWIAR